MEQSEITKWEREHHQQITGWEIIYGIEVDTIIFKMVDKTKMEFKRMNADRRKTLKILCSVMDV